MGATESHSEECARVCAGHGQNRKGSFIPGRFATAHAGHRPLGVFFRLTPVTAESGVSEDDLFKGVEKALRKYFGKRGERVVQDNLKAVSRGYRELMEISREVMLANPGKAQVAAQ